MTQIITYSEARDAGLRHYFNGKECKRGHISNRIVKSGACVECKKEKHSKRRAFLTEEQKEKQRESVKRYRDTAAGRVTTRKSSINYISNKLKIDPIFAAKDRIRLLILASFAHGNYSKTSRTHKILGASFEEVMKHLGCENGIPDGYEIDHIIPMAVAFDEASALRLNHYTNLQLLSKAANLEKRDYLPDGRRARNLSLEEKKAILENI